MDLNIWVCAEIQWPAGGMIKRQARMTNCQLKKQPVFSPQYIIAAKIRVCDLKYIICYNRTLCKTYDMTHICYFYQRDVKGFRRQEFSRFVLPFFLFSPVSQIIMNGFFVRINLLAFYQGMEEVIICGIYHSHFTGSICSPFDFSPLWVFLNFLSNHSHFTRWTARINVLTWTRHRLSVSALNVHRMTVFFNLSL